MKKKLVKILILSFSLFLLNCNKSLESHLLLAKALQELLEDDKKSSKNDENEKEKKEITSDSDHTLSNDISFLPSVSLENFESKTVSLNHKVGDKYVSSRIILNSFTVKSSLSITTSEDIGIEIYRGSSPLKTKNDKENRFEKVGKNNFKLSKRSEVYSIETQKEGVYTLLLVHSSEIEAKIWRVGLKDEKNFNFSRKIEITENVQNIPILFEKEYKNYYRERTIQLTYNFKRGDRIMVDIRADRLSKTSRGIFGNFYRSASLFKNEQDMQNREMTCKDDPDCGVWADYANASPGYIVFKAGSYSNVLYLYNEGSFNKENNRNWFVKMVKITPKVPIDDSIAITESFQNIEYTLDKRNELYSAWTSKQFTLTGAKKGTKIIVSLEKNEKPFHLPELSFYRGTEKLTKENINNRYLYESEVVNDARIFDGNYSVDKPGDYSIVFHNFNDTKLLHKVKIENE